ncbi:Uncharacterised protein [Mycobacteroides abscessus subsp. abscessus]|nr:Uncharacterised protein [Mycobacteroides abscessus subsp. abscessus]
MCHSAGQGGRIAVHERLLGALPRIDRWDEFLVGSATRHLIARAGQGITGIQVQAAERLAHLGRDLTDLLLVTDGGGRCGLGNFGGLGERLIDGAPR